MPALDVTILQADLHWHDANRNRELFADQIGALEQPTDLIVLPEMFTTGFTMDAKSQAERMDGASMAWLATMAATANAAVCGSLIVEEDGHYFNRFVIMHPNGDWQHYDKRHLFALAKEDRYYSAGTERMVFDLKGVRVCPMICYDLRFPVWSRSRGDYDLLLFVANWPAPRHHAWQTLIRARAIENQCFVAAVNRCGTDGNDLPYLGGSAVLDYLGEDLVDLGDAPGTGHACLDLDALGKFRDRFPFHVDADEFTINS